jgi:hypothetical protein
MVLNWTARLPAARPVPHAQFRCGDLGLINTVASARCKKAPRPLQPFQGFGWERGKPLKRLGLVAAYAHRAEAAVLMRDQRLACTTLRSGFLILKEALVAALPRCEISGLRLSTFDLRPSTFVA